MIDFKNDSENLVRVGDEYVPFVTDREIEKALNLPQNEFAEIAGNYLDSMGEEITLCFDEDICSNVGLIMYSSIRGLIFDEVALIMIVDFLIGDSPEYKSIEPLKEFITEKFGVDSDPDRVYGIEELADSVGLSCFSTIEKLISLGVMILEDNGCSTSYDELMYGLDFAVATFNGKGEPRSFLTEKGFNYLKYLLS